MKLTVIVLAYNVEKYIREALDSILMQKVNFSYEIVIGNDGSSDGTVDILKEYEKKYGHIIKLKLTDRVERAGSGDYINFANLFLDVKSEYFCVLDGDDFWTDENKLQKQIDFLDQNSDFTVCGHNYWLLYEDGKKVKSYDDQIDKTNYSFVAPDLETLLLKHECPYMQTSSLVYRNVFAQNLEVKNKLFSPLYSGDLIRTLLHSQKGKVKYLNQVMSVYRIIPAGDWNHRSQLQQIRRHIDFYSYHKNHSFDKKYKNLFNTMIKNQYGQILLIIKPLKFKDIALFIQIFFKKKCLEISFSKKKKKISKAINYEGVEIRKYLNESYSQQGEDAVLFGLVGYNHFGFYVDVGAHHPQRFSNTFKFYKMGWSGINIDPMPQTKVDFDIARPRDINIEIGIGGKEGILNYHMFEEPAINTFSEEAFENFRKIYPTCKVLGVKKIPVTTLEKCLDQYMPDNTAIDFMSVDCEGMDFEVLKSNNWNKYRPKIVVCEISDADIEDVLTSEITKYLQELGYQFIAKTGLSSFFILK